LPAFGASCFSCCSCTSSGPSPRPVCNLHHIRSFAASLVSFSPHSFGCSVAITLFIAQHCSPQVALFQCWKDNWEDSASTKIPHPPPKLRARNISKLWRKRSRPRNFEHGKIRPPTDHNDTRDEAFGYSGRNWHGHTTSVSPMRREA